LATEAILRRFLAIVLVALAFLALALGVTMLAVGYLTPV
jgi:hypothetical protein